MFAYEPHRDRTTPLYQDLRLSSLVGTPNPPLSRLYRQTVTQRLLAAALDFQEAILDANSVRGQARLERLNTADAHLNKVRLYLRLAHRWQWINPGQYEHASRMVAELGRLLGGWQRVTPSNVVAQIDNLRYNLTATNGHYDRRCGGRLRRRVLRGGAFNNNRNNVRCANRINNNPDERNNNVGFRVCSHGFHPSYPLGEGLTRILWRLPTSTARDRKPVQLVPGRVHFHASARLAI